MKGRIIFYTKWSIDVLLTYVPFALSAIWLGQVILTLPTEGLFGGAWLFPFHDKIHNITTLVLISLYSYTYLNLNYLPARARVPASIGFVLLPMTANGIIWNTCDHFIRGGSNALLPASYFFVTVVMMYIINQKISHPFRKVFELNWRMLIILFPLFILSLYIFISSGFFTRYDLMLKGLHSDPHGWEWGVEQIFAYWVWISILRGRI